MRKVITFTSLTLHGVMQAPPVGQTRTAAAAPGMAIGITALVQSKVEIEAGLDSAGTQGRNWACSG